MRAKLGYIYLSGGAENKDSIPLGCVYLNCTALVLNLVICGSIQPIRAYVRRLMRMRMSANRNNRIAPLS